MSLKKLIIFGTSEIAELAYFYFTNDSSYEVACFCVDDAYFSDSVFCGLPVVPYSELNSKFPPDKFHAHVALSYKHLNKLRESKYNQLKDNGYDLASYVSSKSVFWNDLEMGENCFILENQTLQPKVVIGSNVMLWSGNHIGHGTVIKNHVYVSSHVVISGNCSIGERCFLGVNSTIKDFCKVGDDCFIAMDASVAKNLEAGTVIISQKSDVFLESDRRAKALKKMYFSV
jgi:sugar O-acyltransferase (sialic acid O-acetyltransferase NeuD family)